MHLVEVLSARSEPAAGVTVGITRRCPLSCAHCSTRSTLRSEQLDERVLRDFVESFDGSTAPRFLVMSGGEPMLRPRLVRDLAVRARASGARSMILTGAFFARSGRMTGPIREAVDQLDHVSVSLDVFHEREVPRADVVRLLGQLAADGKGVSVHIAGRGPDDPYLDELVRELRDRFDDRIPMLVNSFSYFGRARDWLVPRERARAERADATPCGMATWPVVGFDGTVVACGNDDVIDGPVPSHLRLGDIREDSWRTIRERCLGSATVRALRLFGPLYIEDRYATAAGDGDYCRTCRTLLDDPVVGSRLAERMAAPSVELLEAGLAGMQQRAGAASYARRHAMAKYADLTTLGAPG